MRAVICSLLLLAFSCNLFASQFIAKADTTKRSLHVLDSIGKKQLLKSDYDLSKDEYTKRYGFDDNAIKIIHFYFDKMDETKAEKRNTLLLYLLLLIPISLIGAAFFYVFISFIASTLFLVIAVLNIILFINNMLSIKQMQQIFSKPKLLKTLISYRKTKQFPDTIKKYKKKEKQNRLDEIE